MLVLPFPPYDKEMGRCDLRVKDKVCVAMFSKPSKATGHVRRDGTTGRLDSYDLVISNNTYGPLTRICICVSCLFLFYMLYIIT